MITKKDVFSPANAVSVLGLVMTIWGSLHINSLEGVLILGLGRFIDIFDGKIARATHASRLGAIVDATCDKIGFAFLVPAIWIAGIAPVWLLVYILGQNLLNVVFSGWAALRHAKPTSSRYGKHAVFMQNISLGLYALGNTIDNHFCITAGLILGVASIYWAARATYGYFKLVPEKPVTQKSNQ